MKRTIVTTLGQAEEIIAELEEYESTMIDFDSDKIETFNYRFVLPQIHLTLREGIYYNQLENGEFEPDFNITLVYLENEKNLSDYIYWEQDSLITTLNNFPMSDKPKDLFNLRCIIEIEE